MIDINFHVPDIDECASAACQNGGTCDDRVYSYTCNCDDGYTGEQCQTGICINIELVQFIANYINIVYKWTYITFYLQVWLNISLSNLR